MISVQNISKNFQHTIAVNSVSFDVKEGETMVLLGTSGSGKTTTLRMINRLTEPSRGSIVINNKNILQSKPESIRRKIGYVLQGYGLFPHYTVAENIAVVPKLLHWTKEKINLRADELMHKLQLPQHFLHAYPHTLSGGQKQRVGLARALAADPPILLMDEPFGALDPLTRTAVRKEFKSLDELKKKIVIMVTHDVQEAFELGDKIGLMDEGKLVQTGTPVELLFNPCNEFVRDFLSQQRLQLELQSVTLESVWDELPDANSKVSAALKSNQSLWEAAELLAESDQPVIAMNEQTESLKQIEFKHLQIALQKQRNK